MSQQLEFLPSISMDSIEAKKDDKPEIFDGMIEWYRLNDKHPLLTMNMILLA